MNESMTEKTKKKFYNDIYEKEILKEPEPYYDWILNLLYTNGQRKVLDIGCGGGFLLKAAVKRGLSSIGIEISHVAAHVAKKNSVESDIILADGENLPLRDGIFDYVTCLGSLEHFSHPEKGAVEMNRVLKSDGKACVVLPNNYFIKDIYKVWRNGIAPSHGQPVEKFATKIEWENLLNKHGLRALTVYKYNPRWKIMSAGHLIYRLLRPLIPLNLSYCFAFVCCRKRN